MTVPKKTRALVLARDGDQCVHCGTTETLTLNHRASRGMGGAKSLDGPENLVVMCWWSNERLESSAAFADLGRIYGWKLARWQAPTEVPVLYADGDHYTLTTRGTRIKENLNG